MNFAENKMWGLLTSYFLYILLRFPDVKAASVVDNKSSSYTWKTGLWNACFTPDTCGEGSRGRQIWCAHSSGFIVDEANCKDTDRPATVEKCFRVCKEHMNHLRWSIKPWSSCSISKAQSHSCSGTISGMSTRQVDCLYEDVNTGQESMVESQVCEYFYDKPDSQMACSMDCPQDCMIAKRNVSCDSCDGKSVFVQVTDVIVSSANGGKDCTSLQNPTCPGDLDPLCEFGRSERQQKYFLKIGKWQPCVSEKPDSLQATIQIAAFPVIGYSQRNVTCISADGQTVDISMCNSSNLPVLKRRCVVPQDCEFSSWSEWRVIAEGCVNADDKKFPEERTRTRTLVQIPFGDGARPCPLLYERRNVAEGLSSCHKYKWIPLPWSDCELRFHDRHGYLQSVQPTCGSGIQYRNVTCLKAGDLSPADKSLCKNPLPVTVRRCEVSCQRDCLMSSWSRWGPCLTFNNTDYFQQIKSGYRTRSRSVIVNPSLDGDPCPHLHEIESCNEIEVFQWKYGTWSECVLSKPQATCGAGRKTRDVTCVNYNGSPMGSFYCEHQLIRGEVRKDCSVPCPNDCLHSDWSDYTTCTQKCYSSLATGIMRRNRTILAIQGEGGMPCPRRRHQEEDCNMGNCEAYKWVASPWSECTPRSVPNDTQGALCGVGVQVRDVVCEAGDDEEFDEKLCSYIPKMSTERDCYLPCPIDCLVSNFSDWTHCEANCDTNAAQYRRRIILQPALHGGKDCPDALVEARPCSSANDVICLQKNKVRRTKYMWSTGSWGKCTLISMEAKCGPGVQVRSVTCVDQDGRKMEPHRCSANPAFFDILSAPPPVVRECEITCGPYPCILTSWSEWDRCRPGSDSKISRMREYIDNNPLMDNCQNRFQQIELKSCPALDPPDHWMSCIVQGKNQTGLDIGQRSGSECGEGNRYRYGYVLGLDGKLKMGVQEELCVVDCPLDCEMMSWSEWSPCDVPCGHGFSERKRHVVVAANDLGRPCPDTVNKTETQKRVCSIQCSNFHWFSFGWSECQLSDDSDELGCGNGRHQRTVICLDRRSELEVDTVHCDPLLKPEVDGDCRIYCPGECVVSPWVSWKECSEPCSRTSHKEVQRRILRNPDPMSSPCPALVSQAPCVLNVTCHEHQWGFGPWGTCVLPHEALCGEGVQERPLICYRSDGRQVDAIQCEKNHKPLSLQEPISKPCYVDCPIDCVLSEWSEWNDTDCAACNTKQVMSRTRYVIQHPSDAGRPCPPEVMQFKPCSFFEPRYRWKTSNWTACKLENADCGYGIRRREVECFRSDGFQVDKVYCLTVNVTFYWGNLIDPKWLESALEQSHEEELCEVPCPGACRMSEWSGWSHCQKNCRIGQIVGYRTSSRVRLFSATQSGGESCPQLEWRNKPCWDDDCEYFQWKVRNGTLVCEGKNGLIVEDGCTSRPNSCRESCEKLGGQCDLLTGLCYCEDGPRGRRKMPISPLMKPCEMALDVDFHGPHSSSNHSASTQEIRLKYFPDDSQASVWMYAMISIGTAFVIFVVVTVYLMCRSSARQRSVNMERQASLRRRDQLLTSTPEHNYQNDTAQVDRLNDCVSQQHE